MALQAAIGRSAENGEIEQLEKAITEARSTGLLKSDASMSMALKLLQNLRDTVCSSPGIFARLKFKANYVEVSRSHLEALRKAVTDDNLQQLNVVMDACDLDAHDCPFVRGALRTNGKWTYRSDLLYDNWGMDWHYRKCGYSIFRHACAQSSINIVKNLSIKSSENLKDFRANDKSDDRYPQLENEKDNLLSPHPGSSTWDFFICHSQSSGGDQAQTLALHLKTRGYTVWYDNDMVEVTEDTMLKGVSECGAFILFLSGGVFTRPFCQMEIAQAVRHSKVIIPVYESDSRHGAFNFAEALKDSSIETAFKEIATALVNRYEAIPYRRKRHERNAMLDEIIRRSLDTASKLSPSLASGHGAQLSKNSGENSPDPKMFPPGLESIWPIVGIVAYIVARFHMESANAIMIGLVVANRGQTWHWWWKYRHTMGHLYDDLGSLAVMTKTVVRYTDSGFLLGTLWALWRVMDLSNLMRISYDEITLLTFGVLFAIGLGFWIIYPLQASSIHLAPGCWWYNLLGDLLNHGPMFSCVASELCSVSNAFKAPSTWELPIWWTLSWYILIFLPWYLITNDELYCLIPASKQGPIWTIARAAGTLFVCCGLCVLNILALKLGQLISADGDCSLFMNQKLELTISLILIVTYTACIVHGWSLLPSSDRVKKGK